MSSKESYQKNREKRLAYMREYYLKNKETVKARAKKWYEANKDKALARSREYSKEYYLKNGEKKRAKGKQLWKSQRLALISQVSNGENKCARCGFSDIRALQVDHVNGGGRAEIRSVPFRSPQRYAKHIALNPDNYQVLCANCNWIKRDENNEY